jgi:hypothetical protein
MEDKRGIKHERSHSVEGSPSPSDAKTPLFASSRSPPPPGSPSETSSCRPCSLVFEQGGPSRKAPVIDLSSSSNEEDLIAATSRDFEFVQRLFGELNRVVLRPPDDGKIIILSNSDEEEVCEEKTTGIEDATASVVVNPASIASADANDAPARAKNNNSDDDNNGDDAGEP